MEKLREQLGIETWHVFGGEHHELYLAVLKERCVRDGLDLPLGWLLPLAGFGLAWGILYRVAAWAPEDRQLFAGLERR